MLRVEGLTAGYGPVVVLRNVSLRVPTATARIVEGPNGAGKTTLVHTIAGLLPARDGTVELDGVALHRLPSHRTARAGVALVPQGRRVFGSLTVAEHLALAERRRRGPLGSAAGPFSVDGVLDLLAPLRPLLRRYGRQLSGGEQQLLAIARALVTNPALLLLDEPVEGLAPSLAGVVAELIRQASAHGITVLATQSEPVTGAVEGRATRLGGTRLSIREE